ncbi:MAG: hypothetical protein FXF47_09175 [Candidatus Mcinerneyibacterium aminivorans]|jgi:hypothetical protein|uniref:DUF6754 domain-containing protein n=1 Tax=Candidatus Mcinerneyibacterium aminivorans TaxID=2703815 RepID=A0A5D0MFU5_9BACT|nr:MAG: hypothetical protein FXF47_09175 [Candidatus Mcinerneyibacterium aminivorans]
MKRFVYILVIISLLFSAGFAEEAENNNELDFTPKGKLEIKDKGNDDGTGVNVFFRPQNKPEEVKYYLLRVYYKSVSEDNLAAQYRIENKDRRYKFNVSLQKRRKHPYPNSRKGVARVYVSNEKGEAVKAFLTESTNTSASWFNINKLSAFMGVLLFLLFVYIFIKQARRGVEFFIRKIPGLEELDNAVGRATELGKPIYYIPGIGTTSRIATLASLNILAPVTRKVAKFATPLKVPNRDPVVMSIAQDVVKEGYMAEGRPDLFNSNDVFFLTRQQFAFAGAVSGLFKREKPGAVFLLGKFYAESLIFAETANDVGAIQIAGTDSVSQIPFFIAACDYTLIGEELFAASGYLSGDPLIVGTMKAQDYLKAILIVLLFIGIILNIFDIDIITKYILQR